jgi:signal transduction histidine kinase
MQNEARIMSLLRGVSLMQLRFKLVLSNILMAVLPLLVIVLLGVAGMKVMGYNYIATLVTLSENESELNSAQNVISAAKQEALPREDGGTIDESALTRMADNLSSLGFLVRVSTDGQVLLSTMTPEGETIIQQIAGSGLADIDNLALESEKAVIIKSTFDENDTEYIFLAVHAEDAKRDNLNEEVEHTDIWEYIPMAVIVVLLVLILTNIALTVWISTSVLRPLKALRKGTKEIRDGNLDDSLPYQRKDEFGQVCADFDEMRLHLKQSVLTQLQYEQYRKELIAGISHDLRTPLTSIKGYVQGLKDNIADTPEKRARYFSAIETRTADLEALVDNLASFSQMETGHYAFHFAKTNLVEWLTDYLEQTRMEAEKRNQQIALTCDIDQAYVMLDVREMGRVMTNLLCNSAKYAGKPKSSVQVTLTKLPNGTLHMIVKDDGPGVTNGELTQIFEGFYRGDAARTQPGKGNGLGLSIARQIIFAHGGTITADVDGGLRIIIDLPAMREEA